MRAKCGREGTGKGGEVQEEYSRSVSREALAASIRVGVRELRDEREVSCGGLVASADVF